MIEETIIKIYSSNLRCLASVDYVSKRLHEMYLGFNSLGIATEFYNDLEVVDDLVSNDIKRVIHVVIHPAIMKSNSFSKIVDSMNGEDRLVIHVFGDFSRHLNHVGLQLSKLSQGQLTLITPSETFGNLVRKLIITTNIYSIPFPILQDDAHKDLKQAKSDKKNQLCKSGETIFLYTGRISAQKNIDFAIEVFNEISKNIPEPCLFYIIGMIDEVEVATVGARDPIGKLYNQINRIKDKRIVFLDQLPRASLTEYYLAADFFISCSTFHDEDFGISPLESISYGCFNILTSWGGFKDLHKNFNDQTYSINVKVDEDTSLKLNWNLDDTVKCLEKFKKHQDNLGLIQKPLSLYNEKMIMDKLMKQILNISESKFEMTKLFKEIADNGRKYFYDDDGRLIREKYMNLYRDFGINE